MDPLQNANVTVNSAGPATSSLNCSGGEWLVGGGVSFDFGDNSADQLAVVESYPSTPGLGGTWTVTVHTTDAFTGSAHFSPWAVCAS